MTPDATQIAGALMCDDQGRYLLVQERIPKAYGLWNLPAGHVDPGETPQQAAVRECKEEVGLEISIDAEPFRIFRSQSGKQFSAFSGRLISGNLQPDLNELLDARWLTYSEIEQLDSAGKIRDPGVMDCIKERERR